MINFAKEDDYIKVNRVEQQFIKKNHPLYEIVDKHCFYSKNVYNQANYLMRQSFTKENKVLSEFEIQKLMQNMDCYKECGSQAAQKTIQMFIQDCIIIFIKIIQVKLKLNFILIIQIHKMRKAFPYLIVT